jgi:hypothetical protein
MSAISLVVHGHFYQPPRENPWTDSLEREPSAAPFHDWNARIHAECYRANAFARIKDGGGRIEGIVNNYGRISFNFGPTLTHWLARHDPRAYVRLMSGDVDQMHRFGKGGAVAQAYAHPILPLCTPADRHTQLLWGLHDFRLRFGRDAEGIWLPETAACMATIDQLIELGVRYTILAPEQVAAVRPPGANKEWSVVDRDTVDTGRAYRIFHRDGSGRSLTACIFDGPLSRSVAFSDAMHDAASFVAAVKTAGLRSSVAGSPLVLCASDGELFGHHRKFADLTVAFATRIAAARAGVQVTNLSSYLDAYPATWEMKLWEGPDGLGSSWSCGHGVGRWFRDCGCSMAPSSLGWNQKWRGPLRKALDVARDEMASFFQEEGASLFVDAWHARNAYGQVLDAAPEVRDALIRSELQPSRAGSDQAVARGRLLLEMQRASLLMYASCAYFFDDIAGLEARLVMRLLAYALELLRDAGGKPPTEAVLDWLAQGKSNRPENGTGADVFQAALGERVGATHVAAAATLHRLLDREGAPGGEPCAASPPFDGYDVVIRNFTVEDASRTTPVAGVAHATSAEGPAAAAGDTPVLVGRGVAEVTHQRTGRREEHAVLATWDEHQGLLCQVAGETLRAESLGTDARRILLPVLLPRLLGRAHDLVVARWALVLGRGTLGDPTQPDDLALRHAYGDVLVQILSVTRGKLPAEAVPVAVDLMEAAGPSLAPGSERRHVVEELVAQHLEHATPRSRLAPLLERLGFSTSAAMAAGEHV